MTRNVHDNYLVDEVMSADPVKLVRILYRAALDAVAAARAHLRDGAIRDRSRQITKALQIVHELLGSIDCEVGGEIAKSLSELYVYMTNRLIEANTKQIDSPLAEVEALLSTLLEAWSSIPAATLPEDPAEYEPAGCSY